MEKTIIVLTRLTPSEEPFVSYVFEHSKALKLAGFNVIVFAISPWFPFFKKKQVKKSKVIIDGITIYYFNRISFSTLFDKTCFNVNGFLYYKTVNKTISQLLKKYNVVLIDAHYYKIEGYAAYLLKKQYNLNTFVTLHGTSFNSSYKTHFGKKEITKISKLIDLFICVSPKLLNQLKNINIENSKVIYNGINNSKLKLNNDNYNIVTGTSLVPLKNIDLIIQSFKSISLIYPKAKLTIIGTGSEEERLKNIVSDLFLNEKVEFLGRISNEKVFEILSNSKVYAMVSQPEGFGLIYLEAMLNGCTVIGTIGEGIDGTIINNYNGYLINPNVKDITKTIKHIFASNDDTTRKNAIETAKKFTWEKNAMHYIESAGLK